jgi:hypothetical protein
MKQRAKIYFCGILVFILILGACPTDSGTTPDRSKLKLSGQVYIQEINLEKLPLIIVSTSKYNDNLTITDGELGGNGEVKNGQLSYSIDVEPPLLPINEDGGLDYLKERYSSLKFSSEDVNAAAVALEVTDNEKYSGLLKGLLDIKLNIDNFPQMNITITIKILNYIYIDKDLKITADADKFEYTDFGFPIKLTTEKINLNLKKGWNSLYEEITAQSNIPPELIPILMGQAASNPDLSILDLSALEPKGNLKMSVGDPGNLNWTLIPSQYSDIDDPEYPQPPQAPEPFEPF